MIYENLERICEKQNKTSIEEAFGFYMEYLQDFTTTKQKVWDEKKT
jgi:hypothetical protein